MSKWAVYENHTDQSRHAVPVDDEGELLGGHVPTTHCECGPKLKEGLWLHFDPERGGFNS